MPDHRQKKTAKQKSKRSNASHSPGANPLPSVDRNQRALARIAVTLPVGPFFISSGWQDPDTPRVHVLIGSRFQNNSTLLPAAYMLDLGCEGVRDAFVMKSVRFAECEGFIERMFAEFGLAAVRIEALEASALVRQLTEFANSNGFPVPSECDEAMKLIPQEFDPNFSVELGRNGKPVFTHRPQRDNRAYLVRLIQAVGPNGFAFEQLT
ncbi:MAG: hypothetical protein FWD57_15655 [Polyangiaceae bacterium]|nr:hypothetical protein [Polyangiaceae bacterium]